VENCVEAREVSSRNAAVFHKHFNTYVENFTREKYFAGNSARGVR